MTLKLLMIGFGHQEGDKVLTEIGELILDNSRLNDIVCRYGGEELTAILPDMDTSEAMIIGERLVSPPKGTYRL